MVLPIAAHPLQILMPRPISDRGLMVRFKTGGASSSTTTTATVCVVEFFKIWDAGDPMTMNGDER